jgi:AraC-like DNA-binding protein
MPQYTAWSAKNRESHGQVEIMLALEGDACFGLDGDVYQCRPGTLAYLAPNDKHDYGYPQFSPDCTHLWLGIFRHHIWASVFQVRQGESQMVLWHNSHWSRTGISQEMIDFLYEARPTPSLALRVKATAAAVAAHLLELDQAPHRYAETRATPAQIVASVKSYITDSIGSDVSLDRLAAVTGYSKFHLLRLFKLHTGVTVHDYVDQCRLEKVEQLVSSGVPHKAIASELGFSCPSSFSRWYRRCRPLTTIDNAPWEPVL